MKRIQIFKNSILTNQADFKTDQLLNDWFENNKANKSFGRNLRELQARKDIDGNWYVDNEDILKATSFREETVIISPEIPADPEIPDSQPIPAVTELRRYYTFPADYTFTITDVTSEYNNIENKRIAIEQARTALVSTKPIMTLPEASDAINKILLVLGIK
jgi:hypothetical protein